MKKKLGIPIPGEHGAWAVLYASFAVGWAASDPAPDMKIFLLLIAVTGLFLSHEPLVKLLRARKHGAPLENRRHWLKWMGIYLSAALLAGAILLLVYQRWILLAGGLLAAGLFSIHLRLAFRRQDRNLAGEVLGIMGLTLTAPAVAVTAVGHLDSRALLVWLSCVLYFASGIFYVKMRVSHRLKPIHFTLRKRQCLAYHTTLLILLIGASIGFHLPALMLLGFVPIIARAFWHAFRPGGTLDLKKIGYREVLYTVIFAICSSAGWIAAG